MLDAAVDLDQLLFDSPDAEREAARKPLSVSVSVLPNADIVVGENNIFGVNIAKAKSELGGDEDSSEDENKHKLAHALDVTGDLDIWVEFIKNQAE